MNGPQARLQRLLALLLAGAIPLALAGCEEEAGEVTDAGEGVIEGAGDIVDTGEQALVGDDTDEPAAAVQAEGNFENALAVSFTGEQEVRAQDTAALVVEVVNTAEAPVHDVVLHYTLGGSATAPPSGQEPQAQQTAQGQQAQQQGQQPQQGQGQAHTQQPMRERIGRLEPGESRQVNLSHIVQSEGQLQICAWATGQPTVCHVIDVVAPQLRIERMFVIQDTEVDTAYACDPVAILYRVTNAGTGTAENVVINETLPQGMTTEDGAREINQEIGSLEAGQSEEVRIVLASDLQPGEYQGAAVARTPTLGAQSRRSPLRIVRPQIELTVDAPSTITLGQGGEVRITVRNTSDVPARDALIALPEGVQWDIVDGPSQVEGGIIDLGDLRPGESRSATAYIVPREAEPIQAQIAAKAYCAAEQTRQINITVEGLPALQLEMTDEGDTFPVGEDFEYQIRVVNEGHAEDLNIRLQGELPPGLSFVEAAAPEGGEANVQGQTIRFSPLGALEPGDEAIWMVRVRGQEPGKFQRFQIQLNSDSMRQPIRETETTTIY